MTMGAATKDNDALKLVHPGGYVEVHKEPIIAAEVLKKNPRHCITRPDVFKYPWIVVRPESVLELGKVFFIVPNHTLYRLLQESESQHQPSSLCRRRHSHKQYDQNQLIESGSEVAPKYQDSDDQRLKRQSQERDRRFKHRSHVESRTEATPKRRDHDRRRLKQQSPAKSLAKISPDEVQNCDRRLKQEVPMESWTEVTPKYQDRDQRLKQQQHRDQHLKQHSPVKSWVTKKQDHNQSVVDSWVEMGPFHAKNLDHVDDRGGLEWPTKQDYGFNFSEKATMLKSCLRKHRGNNRRSRGLRVNFDLPIETDKEKLKKSVSRPNMRAA